MLNIETYNFGTFALKTKAPEHIVERLFEEGKKQLETYNHSLAGHLKSQFLYSKETIIWFYTEMQPYWNSYREHHCNFHGADNKYVELTAMDLWVNFMKKGDYNPLHTHGGDISFVLYLDFPKELYKEAEEHEGPSTPPGYLEFQFGQPSRPKWFTYNQWIKPETGDIIIFPAMLQHTVLPFKSDVTRVSVSGNLAISNRKDLGENYF